MKNLSVFSRHPNGLFILFFSELWERFSFYGMRSLLVLYMTKQMLYSDERAYGVYGAYGALVYAFPVLGGILADRVLGTRRAVVLGGVLMALGHFLMAIDHVVFFYGALALICLGNGFFKPNISSTVGKLYPVGDPRRDSGFTIFYMGINIGGFLAPLACGLIGEVWGWHFGFSLAGIGMVLGLIVFLKGQSLLGEHGLPPEPTLLDRPLALGLNVKNAIYTGSFLMVPAVAFALYQNDLVGNVLYIVGALSLAWLLYTAFNSDPVSRGRLLVIVVLMFFHMAFWAFFEQTGSSLMLFADRNVDRMVWGGELKTSMTQSFNSFFIITLAPLFAWGWERLQTRSLQPSVPVKFALGVLQVGLGFGALVVGASLAGESGKAALIWLVLAYFFHTTGELCLSPVGLSAVTKLAPAKVVSSVMGMWFLTISFAHHVAGAIAKLTGIQGDEGTAETLTAAQTLPIYSDVFLQIFYVSTGAAILLFLISPLLKKWMHGVE